jgi:hypothetical protein
MDNGDIAFNVLIGVYFYGKCVFKNLGGKIFVWVLRADCII